MRWDCRAGRARPARRASPPPERPSGNRGRKAWASSCLCSWRRLLEHGCENDVFEALERFGVVLDFHAQDGALPGGEQEFGEVMRSEGLGDFANRLAFGDARGEGRKPLGEDLAKPGPQHLALRRGLQTEIADEAAAAELARKEAIGDDVEIAPQTLARATVWVVQHFGDEPLLDGKAASRNSELALTMFLLCSSFSECTSPHARAANGMRLRPQSPPMKQGSTLQEGTWRRSTRRRGCSISKPVATRQPSHGAATGSRSRKRVSNCLAKSARGWGRSPRADGLLPSRGFKTHSAHSGGWSHPPRPGQLQKGYQKNFFIWSGRNSLKSLDSKK